LEREREGKSMTASTGRIVIRHLRGSKINQIEQFDLDGLQEITIGRDPTSRIVFDLQRDDEVSRRHAVIRIKQDKELYFRLADLNSSNGTFLNGERIGGEVELLPEDIVELGSGGPKFVFDVQPRPTNLPARTRQMGAVDPAAAEAATRLLAPAPKAGATVEHTAADTRQRTTASDTAALAKVAVGKATIQRMLFDERRKANHVLIASIAAVLVLAAIGGGALLWHSHSVNVQLEQQLADAQAHADQIRNETDAQLKQELSQNLGISPAQIKTLGDATVLIHVSWQLYDSQTNRPLYQKMVSNGHNLIPAYVRLSDNSVVRWLTLDQPSDGRYQVVGDVHSGSGFVRDSNGYILTNIHVAAAWAWRFQDYHAYGWSEAAVFNVNDNRRTRRYRVSDPLEDDWVPDGGGYVFDPDRPDPISSGYRDFFGRNNQLSVRFPGTRSDYNASLVKISPDADVAEIKIDADMPLTTIPLADNENVEAGQKVILLGYPDTSNQSYAEADSNARGITSFFIPEPTVTEGVVAKLPAPQDKRDGGDIKIKDKFGSMYQLDISSGAGSSGGPVLNSQGKVIALMSMGLSDAEHVAFAVPISAVRELFQAQR
jgi:serine protease Do